MTIRSMRTVLCRTLLGVLDARRVSIFSVSEATCIPLTELRRLLEFGSKLSPEESERLIAWGTRMVLVSRPKAPKAGTHFRVSKPVTPKPQAVSATG